MDRLTKAQMEFMNGYVPATIHDIYQYETGGGIHIKDSKKGTFTAAATKHGKSVQAFASQVLANKDDYSPAMVKKANFARNASKWKHQDGGAAGGDDQQAQIIAIIQAYAKASKMDPQEIVKKIQALPEEQQLPFIQSLADQLQGKMQEGGPTPEDLTGQEQSQGGEDLMQGIQQALQEGAQPEEIIAELLQQQIDPEMVVQIFVQLGMSQEQVIQVIQSVMEQMGATQEQEVPQEQMQEPSMEESMQEEMAYGGIYANNYSADFMPKGKTNSFLTNTNMLSDPSLNYRSQALAATGFKPAVIAEGIKGLASVFTGSMAGYKGEYHKLFDGKNKPATSYNVTGAAPSHYDPMHSSPVVGPQRFEDLPQQPKFPYKASGGEMIKRADGSYSKRGLWDNIRANKGSGKKPTKEMLEQERKIKSKKYGGGIDNPGFNALPDYVQEKIIANMQYGGLPQAQFGIPEDFNFNDPFGMQSLRFGQTADYADTRGYTNGQLDKNAQTAADRKLYNDQQALGAAGQNTISIKDKQLGNNQGKYDGYAFPKYAPKTHQGKTNPKTLNTLNTLDVSGNQMASNALIGAGFASDAASALFETDPQTLYERALRRNNQNFESGMLYNPKNSLGERPLNSGILKPNMHVATQDVGSSQYPAKYGGSTKYRNGGQMQYQQGGEYHVTHDELLQLMQNGAEVEFL